MVTRLMILGQLRHVLTALGSAAIAIGYGNEQQVTEIVGVIVMLSGFIWSILSPEKRE